MSKKMIRVKCPKCNTINEVEAELSDLIECSFCNNTILVTYDRIIEEEKPDKYKNSALAIFFNIIGYITITSSFIWFLEQIPDIKYDIELIYGPLGSFISAFFFFGFGKIIELLNKIEFNTKKGVD